MLIAVIVISACQSKSTKPADITAAKENINALMDKNFNAWNSKDVNTMTALLSDNGLFCGTDPSEFWSKKALVDLWNQIVADTIDYHYSIDKREIKVAEDGNSAIVIEQFTMIWLSPKIPIRTTYYIIKAGDSWMIDFLSWAFIPKNEDIGKLNKALE